MALGLESPADLQPQRLALQVKLLKERFGGAAAAGAARRAIASSRGARSPA